VAASTWFGSLLYAWGSLAIVIALAVSAMRNDHERGPHDRVARTVAVNEAKWRARQQD
jgi:hypothetical protein